MSLVLRSLAESVGDISVLLHTGADIVINAVDKPPTIKSAVVSAALSAYTEALAEQTRAVIQGLLDMHEIMGGDAAELSDDLSAALVPYIDACGSEINDYLDGATVLANGAEACARELAQKYTSLRKPAGPHMGKFLSAINITEPMLQAIDKEAQAARVKRLQQAAPPPPATTFQGKPITPLPPDPPPAAAHAAPPSPTKAAPPPPPAGVKAPPAPPPFIHPPMDQPAPVRINPAPLAPTPQPDKGAVTQALQFWYNDGGPDLDAFAKALGVSQSTLRNRCTGRNAGMLTPSQAGIIIADIDVQIANLQKAAAILSSIRG